MKPKAAVAAAFSAAADTYDASADVQRDTASRLARRIAMLPIPQRPRILEIGCGTGFLSGALLEHMPRELLLTDISEAMLARCREIFGARAAYQIMDGERPAVAPGYDLVCSSLAFQWFDDLSTALGKLAGLLAPGGHLAFATLAADSFTEWRAAHAAEGLAAAVRAYPSSVELERMLPGLAVADVRLVRHYHDAHEFLDHLKQIGAHLPAPGQTPLAAGELRRVLRRFASGISVTYHVAYGAYVRR